MPMSLWHGRLVLKMYVPTLAIAHVVVYVLAISNLGRTTTAQDRAVQHIDLAPVFWESS